MHCSASNQTCVHVVHVDTLSPQPRRDEPERAKGLLAASLRAFPCNWAAWSALLLLCGASGAEPPLSLGLPAHWTAHCFSASLCLELQRNAEALSRLQVVNQVCYVLCVCTLLLTCVCCACMY